MRKNPPVIRKTITAHTGELKLLAGRIYSNPELGFQEFKACQWLTGLLSEWGFAVETPYVGLATAFKAVAGKGRPAFCIMAEYDALPEIGHACGHNLIATAALAAGVALAAAIKAGKVKGSVVVMGTPAEESGGGKVKMIAQGALRGIDAAMMVHPSHRGTRPDTGSSAVTRFDVTFHGLSAHAAAQPEKGKNALDAALLLFAGINAWRQQLEESCRIHGIIAEGGVRPNIIPDKATCHVFLRSPDAAMLDEMVRRFRNIVRGAALMTDTKATSKTLGISYLARKPNRILNEMYLEEAAELGMNPVGGTPGRASSDFGNVTCTVPGIHAYFAISRTPITGAHSLEFARAAGTSYGFEMAIRAAEAVARIGYRCLTDAALRKRIAEEFRREVKEGPVPGAPRRSARRE